MSHLKVNNLFRALLALAIWSTVAFADESRNPFDKKMTLLIANLEQNISAPSPFDRPKVAVLRCEYLKDGVPVTSALCTLVMDKLESALQGSKKYSVLSRKDLNSMITARDWQIESVLPSKPENYGAIAGADLVLLARLTDMNGKIKITAFLKSTLTGEMVSDASILLNVEEAPTGQEVKAENDTRISLVTFQPMQIESPDRIQIETFLNHAPENIYKPGETLVLNLRTDRDCFLRVIYLNSDGHIQQLFPKPPAADFFVQANKLYEIPPPGEYQIIASAPFGIECLKVIASSMHLNNLFETDSTNWTTRGMAIKEQVTAASAFGETVQTIRVVGE